MNLSALDRKIKSIWLKEIQQDFRSDLIPNEDTLKNVFYYHLRIFFKNSEEFQNIQIYTECTGYGFSDIGYIPDLIIVDSKADEILSIFELKYKSEKCSNVVELVYHDFDKLKAYSKQIKNVNKNCQYYVAAITLGEFDVPNWLTEKDTWAKGKVAELIAYEPYGVLNFQVIAHNE